MRKATAYAYECLDAVVDKVIERTLPADWSVFAEKRVAVEEHRISYYAGGVMYGPSHFTPDRLLAVMRLLLTLLRPSQRLEDRRLGRLCQLTRSPHMVL